MEFTDPQGAGEGERAALSESPTYLGEPAGEYLGPLGLSEDVTKYVTVLKDEETGNVAYVIGTAHLSNKAAKDVEELIAAVHPSVVAVELDSSRLSALREYREKSQNWSDDSQQMRKLPKTTFQVLRAWLQGERVMFAVMQTFMTSFTGEYGADMLAAIGSAETEGIPVVPIDRDAWITLKRFKQMRGKYMKEVLVDESPNERGAVRKFQARIMKMAEEAECEDPKGLVDAFKHIMDAAVKEKDVSLDEFKKVRDCARKAVEHVRLQGVKGEFGSGRLMTEKGAGGFGPESGKAPGEAAAAATKGLLVTNDLALLSPVFRDERDLILAQGLRRCCQGWPSSVAVVGAMHVPGLCRHWKRALSPEALQRAEEYNSAGPMEGPRQSPEGGRPGGGRPGFNLPAAVATGLVGLGVYSAVRRPGGLMRLGVGLTAAAVSLQILAASSCAKAARVAAKLEEVSRSFDAADFVEAS